jgi:pyruvate dehydrogenase E2 component (dihydrolipoamide acetyltransferase)
MPDYKQFLLPDTAEGLTEAEIITWHVKPGDDVTINQILVEIETAKAAVELPSPYAGRVTELLAQVGQTVPTHSPIIVIDVDPTGAAVPAPVEAAVVAEPETEKVATLVGYGPKAASARRRPRVSTVAANGVPTAATATIIAAPPIAVPVPVTAAPAAPAPVTPAPVTTAPATPAPVTTAPVAPAPAEPAPSGRPGGYVPLAKPPVRKLARDLGVDLGVVAGSGPSGVITRDDVHRAATPDLVEPSVVPQAIAAGERERRVPVRGVRKATAQAMVESAFTAPHVTEFLTVDVTPMMRLRAKLKDQPAFRGVKLTPLVFAAKAVCLAVRRTPDVNATWDGQAGEIVYKSYVHLGIAAATPRGLMVPKIRDAEQLSLRDLAAALDELTTTARDGKTAPADLVNGTFTITNVGVFGVDTGTPIINPGESAILAFGAIRDMPWVVDGQVVPRKVCQLALSFDHRVVDGEQGSRFLADVGALLADPATAITY